jgi:hypothetical protein
VIFTLLTTVLVESIVVIVYSLWRNKPLTPILLTSFIGNIITQSILWIILLYFFRDYLIALVFAELIVWGLESLILHVVPANKLSSKEAILLSLGMNFASLALGWWLPV